MQAPLRFVFEVEEDSPATGLKLPTHEQEVVVAGPFCVSRLLCDLGVGWSFSINLILPVWFRVNGGVVSDVNETCLGVDLVGGGWFVLVYIVLSLSHGST